MALKLATTTGSYDLEASVQAIGDDLLVAIWGGERPHIGAIAVAQPRPSLKYPDRISSTASVFCLVGHKEDDLAKAASEVLAAALNTTVVVTAGIHWDNITEEGIRKVVENSQVLIDRILEQIRDRRKTEVQ
ncbi:MAG TPA: hypothetical protein ENF92_04215 [Desulfobacteraceae bacterium]|nr:hypothetical protein [Desulfobacteraceae bacterium]